MSNSPLQSARFDPAVVREAANLIISNFPHAWAYFCQFRFALAVGQRALMANLPLTAPSLEIGINDGSSATIAQFGKPKFTWGGDMPEAGTFESMGLHIEPHFDKYENVIGMDAHEIPFADNSFNTVVTNDMLSYGLDRLKILREMIRVLAPGGTLFLSESAGAAGKYPQLMNELRRVVPTVDVLEDPVEFYSGSMRSLGMTEIRGDTWLDHRLCAVLLGFLNRGEAKLPINNANRGFYEESLRALAELLARDSGEGWQVYMTCRKPGELQPRPIPEPICLSCRSPLAINLDACSCPRCHTTYRNEWGNSYVLSDFTKVYSPKTVNARPSAEGLRCYLANTASTLPREVALDAFGRSTRYTIRTLQQYGVVTTAVYSDNPLHYGHAVCGVPVSKKPQGAAALHIPAELI